VFRVTADSLAAYLAFDPARKPDLAGLDALIRKSAPGLRRHFHQGTPAGSAGMRMKMIGYGRFRYAIKSGQSTPWPVIGVALQKNYISVYMAVTKDGAPLLQTQRAPFGEKRRGGNNFSFERFEDLDARALAALFAEADGIFTADARDPVRYMQGGA
jgi:hypothetical protein